MPSLGWQELLLLGVCCFPLALAVGGVMLVTRGRANRPANEVLTQAAAIQCPYCGTTMQAEARFCPGCGEPRTAIRAELMRTAEMTGIPYEELLNRARSNRQ